MSMTVFYVPLLHAVSLGGTLPPEVLFFPSGLHEGASEAENAALAGVRRALPLAPREARAALNEMLRMGEELSSDGFLRQLTAWEDRPAQKKAGAVRSDEALALDAFVSGDAASAASAVERASGEREALVNCQKVLLLADSLEERASELSSLEKRFQKAEAALAAALGEGALPEEGEAGCLAGEIARPLSAAPAVPWRVMLDALLPFLPERALLLSADERMAADLDALLQPLPEERAKLCAAWPQALRADLRYVRLPGWSLAGRQGLPAGRPWLARDVELLLVSPGTGAVQGAKEEGQA